MASPPGSTEPLAARESQIAAHPAVIRGAQAVFISGGWLPTGRVPPMVYPVKSPGMRVGPGFPGASRACLDPETRPRSVACRLSNPEGPRAKQEFGGAPSRSPIVCGTRRDFMVGSALQPGGTARQTGIWWRPLPVSFMAARFSLRAGWSFQGSLWGAACLARRVGPLPGGAHSRRAQCPCNAHRQDPSRRRGRPRRRSDGKPHRGKVVPRPECAQYPR